jgi:hypothetical protein
MTHSSVQNSDAVGFLCGRMRDGSRRKRSMRAISSYHTP